MQNFLSTILAINRRSYRTAVLEDNPVVYHRLGETSGTTAYDEKGVANGTYGNTPTLGQAGPMTGLTSVNFDRASNEKVTFGTASTLAFIPRTGIFTIEAWIKMTSIPVNEMHPIIGTGPPTSENGFGFIWENRTAYTKQLRCYLTRGESGVTVIDSVTAINAVADTNWHHVACSGNGTNVKFYIDGVEQAGTGSMGAKATSNPIRPTTIADCNYSTQFPTFGGNIAEVAVYNSVLSAERVLAHYTAGINS